jgi:ribosome biogenesis GTPase
MAKKKYSMKEMNRLTKKVDKWKMEKDQRKLMNDRRTPLVRKLTRNLNQILIVCSIKDPEFNPGLIDRFILLSHLEDVEPVLCITKIDLLDTMVEVEKWKEIYQSIGIVVIAVSSVTGEGLKNAEKVLKGKSTALAGHSGVGKSSLLMALNPHLDIETAPVNLLTGKGKHVTKTVKMFRLDNDTAIFDLPGIKLIDFPDLSQQDVAGIFPDFAGYSQHCKFNDCTHVTEPECAVKKAVEKKEIMPERYESYLRIIAEMAE